MSEEATKKQGKIVYQSLCQMLDDIGWHYTRKDAELAIECDAQGNDLPIRINIQIDTQRQLITLISPLPFSVPENRRIALAIAVSQANNGMVDGSFDYSYQNGIILFRMTSSYRESLIGKALFNYMLMCSCSTIDKYNDKFLIVVSNKNMSNEEILEFVK